MLPPTTLARLRELRDTILDLLDQGDAPALHAAVEQAWALAHPAVEPEATALAHWCHGLALLYREPRAALEHYEAALAFFSAHERPPEEGRLQIGYAGLLGQLGRLAEARSALERAACCLADAPAEQRFLPALAINRSDVEGRLGNYEAMLLAAREAERLALQHQQPAAQTQALVNQAFAALFLGQFAAAEDALQQAMTVADAPDLRAWVAVNQARLATYRGQLFAALRLLALARQAFAAAAIEQDQATVALEEAGLYARLQLPHEARRAALSAVEGFVHAGLSQEALEALLMAARLALTLDQPALARQDLARAAQYLAQAPPVLQALLLGYQAHPRLHPTRAARRSALAQVSKAKAELEAAGLLTEQLELALLVADLSTGVRLAAQEYRHVAALARANDLIDLEQRALVGLARRLPPAEAWQPLQRAAELASLMRQMMPVEELKASYLTGVAPLYADLINAYLQAAKPEAALAALFEAKGGIWAELAAPSLEAERTPLLHDAHWLRTKAEWDYWQEQLHVASTPELRTQMQQRIHTLEAQLNGLARQHVRQRSTHVLPNLAVLQQALPATSCALEYLVAGEQLVVFLIEATGPPRYVILGDLAQLTTLLNRLTLQRASLAYCASAEQQQRLAQGQLDPSERLLQQLHQLLIAPLLPLLPPSLTQLIIAPDGPLYSVPWAALRDLNELTYLDQQYELILVPSVVVLALPQPDADNGPPLLLGWEGQPPLPHVASELAAIQHVQPEAHCCNPAQLRDLTWPRPPQLLHLALHGQISAQAPLLSQLALADGPLLLADVLNLQLNGTQVVTLSACDTGKVPERGGVALALAGAFLCAGAHATIASLWPVHDAATSTFMANFYQSLGAGQSIPLALRHARAAVRSTGRLHHYYWAAFQPLLRHITPINSARRIGRPRASQRRW
ncbi:hypothetical protein CJ255_18550 [Candidatus Viridilinea mediisalina]|uniref:CHAT domain-containing protein n=2 Tax=Candidatus Viridilinea mediisalina TaxID=2024553 RepID=A0A2A6RFC9_9CHLR|nr:hypothetical protein CJ255_18550 [Candidatus Viridilinea mediisalina]